MLESSFHLLLFIITAAAATTIVLTLLHYPYDVDVASGTDPHQGFARAYYKDAYDDVSPVSKRGHFAEEQEYVRKARAHAEAAGIPGIVGSFVDRCGLHGARVLEVGAGSGLLQDVVDRYTAIDMSSRASRFFCKPFIEASATHIPFLDNSFDAVWSIWVLEHVSNPESALTEIRRVVRNGGYLLLRPAWNCDPWAADGYEVRPYSDLSLKGKLIKASIPIRSSRWYQLLYSRQVRLLRVVITKLSGRPSRFRFRRLKPNYSKYWVTDSDAVVSLDYFEMLLWFSSRGDVCVNGPRLMSLIFGGPGPRRQDLLIRVNKAGT